MMPIMDGIETTKRIRENYNKQQLPIVAFTANVLEDDVKLYEESVIGLDLLNPVFGGATRQASIRCGLEALREYHPDKVFDFLLRFKYSNPTLLR